MMELSSLAQFDDLRRCAAILTDGIAEEEFLRFVQHQEECRVQWLKAVQEAQRLQRELDASLRSMSDLETKLFHARKLLETECKARKEAQAERDSIERKLIAVCDIVRNENNIKDETRDKLAFMNAYPRKRKSMRNRLDELGNDINSTGSFLSDLSLTQSEDDLLDGEYFDEDNQKTHRPSHPGYMGAYVGKKCRMSNDGKRRSMNKSKTIDLGPNEKIIAHTKVTVPQDDGPIYAESIIQAVPQNNNNNNNNNQQDKENKMFKTPTKSPKSTKTMFTPSAPAYAEVQRKTDYVPKAGKQSMMKAHDFNTKTYIKTDTCTKCQKKIKFGSVGLKCKDCRICVHPDCRETLMIACVPQNSGTPILKGQMGSLRDYTPNVGPMIPGLIVHCINEIETRGLNEVGIYRVSGSERDVRALKDKFLKAKGVPFLDNVDIHVLCGCVKDFLRSLKEPLIPMALWTHFSNAVQVVENERKDKEIYAAINKLPQPNRDTLAYLIQHFQRVGDCPETKMPLTNIAKIFAPTIVGYSGMDLDQHAMFAETIIQFNVMDHLLKIPTSYWNDFINIEQQSPAENNVNLAGKSYLETPIFRSARKERKFYATPPYPTNKRK